ncbi:hypothetical protein, partial [Klebsiella pneumoniae]|uniref:hypothetical protein n=1 Tax=Klebsiella pneumoniae TaxID=573 RepID=UPI002B1BE18F
PMFTSGRNEIANAAAGTGQWLQNCSTQTTTTTKEKHIPDYKEYYCNTPKKDNYGSCTILATSVFQCTSQAGMVT